MDRIRMTTRGAALALALLLAAPVVSEGDLNHDLRARSASATDLRAAIAAESKRIAATGAGVRAAQARLGGLQAQVSARQAQLASVQREVISARNHLTRLENRLHDASTALSANLVSSYKGTEPDVVTVVLESNGFNDMLERLQFLERIRKHDARVIGNTKDARAEVLGQTQKLQHLIVRYRNITADLMRARDEAAAVQGALLARQAEQLQQRAHTAARLDAVKGQIAGLKRQIARIATRQVTAAAPVTHNVNLPIDPGGMAQAPPG